MFKERQVSTVKVLSENRDAVKIAIIGTQYNIAKFYEQAAQEKIDRDNMRKLN